MSSLQVSSLLKHLDRRLPVPLLSTSFSIPQMDSDATAQGQVKLQPVSGPAPSLNTPLQFLEKTYDMVDDMSTDTIVSWGPNGNTFVVWDQPRLAQNLLPIYFKHSNFASFVKQLYAYGFHKLGGDRWELANEGFLRGKKHLLKSIDKGKPSRGHTSQQRHRKSPPAQSCVEVGNFGLDGEVEQLKRDNNVLMKELVKLRKQQKETDKQFHSVVQKLQGLEQMHEQMMAFFTEDVNNSGFFSQFIIDSYMQITEGSRKRLKHDGDWLISDNESERQIVKYNKPLVNMGANSVVREISTDNLTVQTRSPFPLSSGPSVLGCNSGASVQSYSDYGMEQNMNPVTLPQIDPPKTELCPLQIVPESCPDAANATASGLNDALSSLTFEDDEEFGWGNSLLNNDGEKLPDIENPFWQGAL